MQEAQIQLIQNRIDQAIEQHVFPGAVFGVVQVGGTRSLVLGGNFTYESTSPVVLDETQYDVASITKSIPTSSIALKLIEEGKLGMDDQLITFIPEYASNYREQVLIRHLLTYSIILDFPIPGFSIQTATPEDIRRNLLTTNLKFPPGEVVQYSNSPALLLTMVIEKITGLTLDVLSDNYFFKSLGMNSSTFAPKDPLSVPPTEISDWRGVVQGVVHDETSFILGWERPSGCAGLFSNVPDILTFLEMLLNKGTLHGRNYFKPKTVTQMHTNQIAQPGVFMGLGWELHEPRFMGTYSNPNMFGKTGFTGTVCVVDIEKGRAFVLLSNRTYPKRTSSSAIDELRRDISDIVFGNEYGV